MSKVADKNNVIILTPPFEPKLTQYKHSIRFDDIDDAQSDALMLFNVAAKRLQPKILMREMFIDTHTTVDGLPSVIIGDVQFVGKALKALDDVHRVIGYVATCGNEMESYDITSLDMLASYWLDTVKTQALGAARRYMLEYCKDKMGITKPLSLNPGSGNVDIWPIEQMQGLFKLLGGADQIGVELTESSLMVPNKSIAGMFFASATTDYESCAYCERKNCPNRRVPFKKVL
jgi:hypothetical protein